MLAETVLKIIGWALIAAAIYLALVFLGTPMDVGTKKILFGANNEFSRFFALFIVLAGLGASIIIAQARDATVRKAAKAVRARDWREVDRIFDALLPSSYSDVLHVAARNGNHELVKRLIAGGVNVNALESWPTAGSTALYEAAAAGHAEIVETLLANGADVDLGIVAHRAHPEDHELGECPLMIALQSGHHEIVRILVEHGADQYLIDSIYGGNSELYEDLDPVVLASARRLRDEGKADRALPIYEELISRLDRHRAGNIPSDVLVVLREFGETHEMNGNWREALDFYSHALRMWKQRRVPSAGAVRLFDGKPVEPKPFSEVALEELVDTSNIDREEVAMLLCGCERVLGRLSRVEEQERVAAFLGRLAKA